ncbi:hypothetical protein BSIN_0362 [Burkholderia singularis]|uniref:Uncharacterized protein n=1 Tax=Burkholderia singularis TaxID=1503053 RepID=A0A238H677_9BURK|nr:hypothetical protein BSIN_0362 [Burkholderia singularis]
MTRRPRSMRPGAPAEREAGHRRALMPHARRGPAGTQREPAMPAGGALLALPVRPPIERTFTT